MHGNPLTRLAAGAAISTCCLFAGCTSQDTPPLARSTLPETAASDYYSPSAEEVVLEFDGVHRAKMTGGHGGETVNLADARWEIDRLMTYLGGPMGSGPVKAGPKYDGRVTVHGADPLGDGWFAIRYSYIGTFTMERAHGDTYPVMVPRDVTTIYRRSQVPGMTDAGRNPCTNPIFSSDTYFWYFWNPRAQGCPLREGEDYDVFQARVTRIPNLVRPRYPDYPRMVNAAGELPVTVVFGVNDDANGIRPPEGNGDFSAENFLDVERRLVAAGFSAHRWSAAEVTGFCPAAAAGTGAIEDLTRQDGGRRVAVRMYLGSTHLGHHAEGFACILNQALKSSALLVYSAHSGLGESVYLQELRKDSGLTLEINQTLYQVFAFNSCSSYGYYNQDFFDQKKSSQDPTGELNLDVITSGTSSDFEKIGKATWMELMPFLEWSRSGKWTSYQAIADSIDRGTLTGVSGVRENPEAPR
jgi:hypothetical protein